jgi:hypothetical protein
MNVYKEDGSGGIYRKECGCQSMPELKSLNIEHEKKKKRQQ